LIAPLYFLAKVRGELGEMTKRPVSEHGTGGGAGGEEGGGDGDGVEMMERGMTGAGAAEGEGMEDGGEGLGGGEEEEEEEEQANEGDTVSLLRDRAGQP
jgi:hypothetical protein